MVQKEHYNIFRWESVMSLIFDRTKRQNAVTRELYFHEYGTTQFQFLGDDVITVWSDGEVYLMHKIKYIGSNGWIHHKKYNVLRPNGRVVCH